MPLDFSTLGAHSLALSSHKLGGPAGAGALLLDPQVTALAPLIAGGGQERGRRGGTPPTAAIAGFAAAAQAAQSPPDHAPWRDAIEQAALACGATVCGAGARLPNTACLALPGVRSDAQVIALDLERIAVSAGAACSSGKVAASHVLQAMGLEALAGQAIRVSLPWNATAADVDAFIPAYQRMAERLRASAAGAAAPPEPTLSAMTNAPAPPNRPVYLDNQATTRCDPRVLEVMLPLFSEQYGNPHSVEHAMGRAAEAAVETARAQVAALLGADSKEIVFTSGATESNNIAIKGAARFAAAMGSERRRVVTVATEHKCVLESVADLKQEGFEPVFLPVRPDGLLDPEILRDALGEPTLLVSVMAVNNETGVVQDIPALAAIAKQAGALFHTDIAQAVGKIPLDLTGWKVDLASVSGHKIYGPKGVGALFVRRRPRVARGAAVLRRRAGARAALRHPAGAADRRPGRGLPAGPGGDGRRSGAHRRAARPAAAAAAGRAAGYRGERQHDGTHPRQSEPDFPCRHRRTADGSGRRSCASPPGRPAPPPRWNRPMCCARWACRMTAASRTLRIAIGRFTSPADVDFAAAALTAAHAGAPAHAAEA